jgi:hypothetical protein
MNISYIIWGMAMIGLGLFLAKIQINSRRKGVKDTFGSEIRLLITGIGLIVIGIIIFVKAFTG